ncbi:MAG: hypothetical protein PHQ40_05665 [Anaerolineaceae bacterium]|nr:hypothetical protein [Anaerolineaceae bacterium]
MGIQRIPSTSNPKVWMRIGGDLVVHGWEQNEISVESGDMPSLRIQQVGDTLRIESSDDCRISIPQQANLEVDKVGGDAAFSDLPGALSIRKVGGDCKVSRVGVLTIARVGGGLALQQVAGDISIDKVGGDMRLDQAGGRLALNSSGGDLELRDVQAVRAIAGGDVVMKINRLDPRGYEVRAGGDFQCDVPENSEVDLELEAGSHSIHLRLPGLITEIDRRFFKQSAGKGGIPLTVKAGGDISIECPGLQGQPTDRYSTGESLDDLGERISRQVEEGFRTADLSTRLTSEMTRRTETLTQRALQHAQSRIQAVLQRLEQPVRSAKTVTPPTGVASPAEGFEPTPNPVSVQDDATDPVSDEERMIILQMLEEKKITVDEAERLLDALESGNIAE